MGRWMIKEIWEDEAETMQHAAGIGTYADG